MLTDPLMGAVALAFLWLHTLLVVYAATRDLGNLLALLAACRSALRGRLVSGGAEVVVRRVGRRGGDGALHVVEHGRTADLDAVVQLRAGTTPTLAAVTAPAEVWAAERGHGDPAVASVWAKAGPLRGATWEAVERFGPGDEVWIVGRAARGEVTRVVGLPAFGGRVVVSKRDPRRVIAARAAVTAAGILGALAGGIACTALAVYPPRFGATSAVGALACLAFFLLVLPLGTALREAARLPGQVLHRYRVAR